MVHKFLLIQKQNYLAHILTMPQIDAYLYDSNKLNHYNGFSIF
nr:MAG TPA: hypothetical protein [Bacteriophage sp.]